MKLSTRFILLGVLSVAASAAHASLTYQYTGHVILSDVTGIHNGDAFSGNFTLDSYAFVGGNSAAAAYSASGTQHFDIDSGSIVADADVQGGLVFNNTNPLFLLGADAVTLGSLDLNHKTGVGLYFAGNHNKLSGTDFETALGTDWGNGRYWVGFDNCQIVIAKLDTFEAVPEPASMAVLGLGALGLIRRRRRN